MQNAQLTLLIPAIDHDTLKSLDLPALKTLINRSDIEELTTNSWEPMLCQLFGIAPANELPIAALTGLADGLSTQTGYWLRADPVQLQADLSAVYLVGNAALNLTSTEINAFKQELNQFFKQDQLQLFTPAANRWYLQLGDSPHINTYPLNKVIGKNILGFLPIGIKQTYWRKLITEVQMLLYVSPHNQHRTQTVNGLWFWGAGQLPTINKTPWQMIWSEDILLKGLAKTANVPLMQPPAHAENILKQLTGTQQHLISLMPDQQTPAEWLKQMEDNWFKPLVKALRKKQINSVALYLGNNKLFHINSKTIRYFWRRKS